MKKYSILLFAIAMLLCGFVKLEASENLEFVHFDTEVNATIDDYNIKSYAEVKNISNQALNLRIKVSVIQLPENYYFSVCDFFTCYPPKAEEFITLNTFTLQPNQTTEQSYYLELIPDENIGQAILQVTFFNYDNPTDYVDYTVAFNIGTSSVDELLSNVNIFPNPASDFLQIDLTGIDLQNPSFAVYDINSRMISNHNLTNVNNLIDVSGLSIGTYFYAIYDLGKRQRFGKFIISR